MNINYTEIKKQDLSHLIKFISRPCHKIAINAPAGNEHYKLLAYLSKQTHNGFIVELGTHSGTSCVALSDNLTNSIRTYDIRDVFTATLPPNVTRVIGNIFTLNEQTFLLRANWIFLDTAHTGEFEWEVYCYLRDNNYNGYIVYDDIHLTPAMIAFWNKIPENIKYDITEVGQHYKMYPPAGTGLVDFGGKIKIIHE